MDIITRKEAMEQGLTHYYTGKPCKHGHVVERTLTHGCIECSKINKKKYRERKPEIAKSYYQRNIERISKVHKIYYQNNSDKLKECSNSWRANNPEKRSAYIIKYKNQRHQATPKWYETDLIKQLYFKSKELSKLLGITLHVDHIVPLQGENVCGLHCWDNLQLLEASLSASKNNSFTE